MERMSQAEFQKISKRPFGDMMSELKFMMTNQHSCEPQLYRISDFGDTYSPYSTPSMSWSCGWATDVSLEVNFLKETFIFSGDVGDERVDDGAIEVIKVQCTVNWSATTRSLSSAAASVQLYQRAIQFGQLIEARFCDSYFR